MLVFTLWTTLIPLVSIVLLQPTQTIFITVKSEDKLPIALHLITVSINHWCHVYVPELVWGLGEVERMHHIFAMSDSEGGRWVPPLPELQDRLSLSMLCAAIVQCSHKGPGRTHLGNKWHSVIFWSMISKLFNNVKCQDCLIEGLYSRKFIRNSHPIQAKTSQKAFKSFPFLM